jgi:hypothetical protein
VLIDAQGYIDGIGPASNMPRWMARLGVSLLQTFFLRDLAGKMAYHDKSKFATRSAVRIGRLHTFCGGWADAKVAFIQSGGYRMMSKNVGSLPLSISRVHPNNLWFVCER